VNTRLSLGLLAALIACAAFAVGASAGGGDSAKSKVKITEGGPDLFEGKVTSGEAKCEKRRKVKLEYRFGGPYKRGMVVGSDKTDGNGRWSMPGSFQAGLYRAIVEEDEKGGLTCRFDRSIRQRF
jgi:hypothetical protein